MDLYKLSQFEQFLHMLIELLLCNLGLDLLDFRACLLTAGILSAREIRRICPFLILGYLTCQEITILVFLLLN